MPWADLTRLVPGPCGQGPGTGVYVNGSSAVTRVPDPGGLCTASVPPSAVIRSASPRSPDPPTLRAAWSPSPMTAPPAPSSVISRYRRPSCSQTICRPRFSASLNRRCLELVRVGAIFPSDPTRAASRARRVQQSQHVGSRCGLRPDHRPTGRTRSRHGSIGCAGPDHGTSDGGHFFEQSRPRRVDFRSRSVGRPWRVDRMPKRRILADVFGRHD